MRAAERALAEAAETHKPVGLILVDIDYFKQINDSFGHAVGDAALKEFTRRLAGGTFAKPISLAGTAAKNSLLSSAARRRTYL